MAGTREESRARTTAQILAAARREIVEKGGVGLSMRAVARECNLVSSAVYRYFPTREALLTAMIVESYGHLDAALTAAAAEWSSLAVALRDWAQGSVHEFQLIYGTPIPGYVAPPETVPVAAAVAGHFLRVASRGRVEGFDGKTLRAQMDAVADGRDPSLVAAVLAELATLVGFVSLEVAGHFVGTADPADELFAATVERQIRTLGLELDRPGG